MQTELQFQMGMFFKEERRRVVDKICDRLCYDDAVYDVRTVLSDGLEIDAVEI